MHRGCFIWVKFVKIPKQNLKASLMSSTRALFSDKASCFSQSEHALYGNLGADMIENAKTKKYQIITNKYCKELTVKIILSPFKLSTCTMFSPQEIVSLATRHPLASLGGTPTWRLHTGLCKFVQNILTNI